ncbi:MAG: 5'/3'-nucleotidase SurE [Chloroflexi bacterium]|nr:5'/3'-nucleotidase SurE [Chloroflexota bacterium]
MTILVTNDDGIYAPGLWALATELKKIASVTVVAPHRERSGVGTAVTLRRPLKVHQVSSPVDGVDAFSVEGTPGDCAIIGLGAILPDGGKMVVSGINQGANLGNDVFISGTVSGALQGHFRHLPSLAISVAAREDARFDVAAPLARLLARRMMEGVVPEGLFLNVNVPNLPLSQILGIRTAGLGQRGFVDLVREEAKGDDGTIYRIVRDFALDGIPEGTDIWAVRNNYISLTPFFADITHPSSLAPLHDAAPLLYEELAAES